MAEAPKGLTERQQKWFASVQASLERDTGKTLSEWVAIARTCPETKPRAQQAWLKERYGLLQNRASYVLSVTFPSERPRWDDDAALRAALWKDRASEAILQALEAAVAGLPDVTTGQRKGYTAWSRKVQMAACRPLKGGQVLAGFAVEPSADPRLSPRGKSESWGDRLKGQLTLDSPAEVDSSIEALLKQAWERS